MRFIKLCFSLVVLMSPLTAQGQANHESTQAVDHALLVLDEFMLTFNARDMDGWSKTLNYPHVRFASGTVTVWETRQSFVADPPFERLQATGWDHSHWLTRDPVLVSEGKVHFNTVFQRFDAENAPIGTYESLYIVTRGAGGEWGIQARSSLAP